MDKHRHYIEALTLKSLNCKPKIGGALTCAPPWFAGASATPVKATVELSPAEASGLRMAALTTLTRLLEMKVLELEGDDGSVPLENDVALLQVCAAVGLRQGFRREGLKSHQRTMQRPSIIS